jgi:hypothetical protein
MTTLPTFPFNHITPWRHLLLCAGLGLAAHGPAGAAPMRLQPGLWEQTQTLKGGGAMSEALAKAQTQMAAMPPERRKMMEEMMARQGVSVGGTANSVRVCISAAQADSGEMPRLNGRCVHQITQRTDNSMHFSFTCAGTPPSSGEGDFTFLSPTAYSGQMIMNSVVNGKPERVEMSQQGRFIGADCGALQPRP